jgi:hypothetical protein
VSVMRLTSVMATVLALEAGGFLIVTLPIDRTMASAMREICIIWTMVFRRSSKMLSTFIFVAGPLVEMSVSKLSADLESGGRRTIGVEGWMRHDQRSATYIVIYRGLP